MSWLRPFLIVTAALTLAAALTPPAALAQAAPEHPELERVMADFVRGWREGDGELLSRVVALDEGRLTWLSGQGPGQRVNSMTFRTAIERDRPNLDYGLDGWRILDLDVVDDRLAFVKLEVSESDVTNIDYMVCYRVDGEWRIVSNTFVIRRD